LLLQRGAHLRRAIHPFERKAVACFGQQAHDLLRIAFTIFNDQN
jgi:hypothetical protein